MTLAGILLPIHVDGREDHIIVTIVTAVATALLGWGGVGVVWVGAAIGVCVLAVNALVRRSWRGVRRSMAWMVVSSVSCTVGFILANVLQTGVFGRGYPLELTDTGDMFRAAAVGSAAWIGAMAVRVLSQRAISGSSVIRRGVDPLDNMLLPYLLPLLVGCPVIVSAVALYRSDAPVGTTGSLLWCVPLYLATNFDLRRREVSRELRRDAFARQRLAAIGEVSARIVHQSRHDLGLMGWSVHRMRALLAADGLVHSPVIRIELDALDGTGTEMAVVDVAAIRRELDALASAKEKLVDMLAAELLHERAVDDDGRPSQSVTAVLTLAELVAAVTEELAPEAEGEGVRLHVDVDPSSAGFAVAPQLRDVIFNLVDNAIDAARSEVWVGAGTVASVGAGGSVASVASVGAGGSGGGGEPGEPGGSRALTNLGRAGGETKSERAARGIVSADSSGPATGLAEGTVTGPASGATVVVVVRVTDDGPGLEGDAERQAFEPFFTTKASGTGMGLSIADALVGDLGGELQYERIDGRTTFTVVV